MKRQALALALLTAASCAAAQDVAKTETAPTGRPAHGGDRTTATLDTVRVTAPRLHVFDPDKLRNRSEDPQTIFSKDWREPTNLRQIGMHGGIMPLAVKQVARGLQAGARKIPGWKGPAQPATARPPPDLDDGQLRRARRFECTAASTPP